MTKPSILSLSMPQSDIAVLTVDDPDKGANVLSRGVLENLATQLDELDKQRDLAGLVIQSGKPGAFIAGADVREFVAWMDADKSDVVSVCRVGQQLFTRLANAPYVTVAAIDGVCLGGGAELALWCDRRIMTSDPRTQYGFPEVKLGIFPGWGGTARAPRMVGLSNAVELITSGEPIDTQAACRMGLCQDIATRDQLVPAAIEMIRLERQSGQYLQDRQRWAGPIEISDIELTFLGATASAYIQQQTKGQYPAPLAALELMLGAAGTDVQRACQMEAEAFAQLFGSPVNRALINVFFLQDRNKKDRGVQSARLEPQPIKRVNVIGAGIMGQGIAAANIKRNIPVTISDASAEALSRGMQKILEEVSYNKAVHGPDVQRAVELAPLLNGTITQGDLAQADLVIEAVVEDLEVKKKVFARLESQLSDRAVLASNTSTIPISRMAEGLVHPERFCGIHFFNPVRRMPLVEVIRGEKTSDQTVATAVGYAKALGKSPIVVGDGPGFLVNRLLLPYMNESLELLMSGASIRSVEEAALAFGMPMGPITLFDVVGIDTAVHAGRVMYEAFPDRVVASELLMAFYKQGRLGQKSGAGFFAYRGGRSRGEPDPEANKILDKRRREQRSFSEKELTMRLFLPMIVEATRVLEERLVRNVRDVDLGLIYGIGFPPSKGGLLFWADAMGAGKVVELLKPYAEIGKRYEPTSMLLAMAREGRKFYDAP